MKNPTVYVFLNETETDFAEFAERTHPTNTFFICGVDGLRQTKTRIQANEGGLSLHRVNVYAVADDSVSYEAAESAGKSICDMFCGDFAIVDMTLAVILNEAERNGTDLVKKLSDCKLCYNSIFLLSNKNEYGEILSSANKNIYEILAGLPLLHSADSHFHEMNEAQMKARVVFASAGFWLKPPPQFSENRALRKLAETLEDEMNMPVSLVETSLPTMTSPSLIGEIASVAAKPLRGWHLWGRTLKEAEHLLFGSEAEAFFNRNYPPAPVYEPAPIKRPLREIAQKEKVLQSIILKTEAQAEETERRLNNAEAYICVIKNDFSVDRIKNKIGGCYTLRHEARNIRAALSRLKAEYDYINAFLTYIRGEIADIKNRPAEEPPAAQTGHAPIAISLLRDDGLIHERHMLTDTDGEPCLLRLIGGFSLNDLTRPY